MSSFLKAPRDMNEAFEENKFHVKDILGGKRGIPRDLSSMLAEAQNLAQGKRGTASSTTTVPASLSSTSLKGSTHRDITMSNISTNSNLRVDDMDVSTFEVTDTQIATSRRFLGELDPEKLVKPAQIKIISPTPAPTGTTTGGNTNVIGYLHHLHNSMVTSIAEETYSRTMGLHEAWLADIAALEWELGQQDLAAALGMNIAVGNAIADDDATIGNLQSSSSSSSSSRSTTGKTNIPGTVTGNGKYDKYATDLSNQISQTLQTNAIAANIGSYIPLTKQFEEISRKYYRQHGNNFLMDNRSRLYTLLRYVSYSRDNNIGSLPDINLVADRWYNWSTDIIPDQQKEKLLDASTLELNWGVRYKHPDDKLVRQWACGGLFYLQDLYKFENKPTATPRPNTVDSLKFASLYTDLRIGNYEHVINVAEQFCDLWDQESVPTKERTKPKYYLCKGITIYCSYFHEGILQDLNNGLVGMNQPSTEVAIESITDNNLIQRCLKNCANYYKQYSNPLLYTKEAQNDPDFPYVLELLSLVSGPYGTGDIDLLPTIIPSIVFNNNNSLMDTAWHRLWLAATIDIAIATGNGMGVPTDNLYSLFSFGKDMIATYDNPLFNTTNSSSQQLFASNIIATPSKKSTNKLHSNPYPITELFILAGLPEYGIAYLASHPSTEPDYNKHLHDAVHLGLALSQQGLLRIFPFNLSTTATLAKKLPLVINNVPLDSIPHDISRFCYGLESNDMNSVTDLPAYTLDLTYLCVTYCARILQDYPPDCLNYYSLLPDKFSRTRTMAMVLSSVPKEFIRTVHHSSKFFAHVQEVRKNELKDITLNAADIARQKGDVDKAVLLYRYLLDEYGLDDPDTIETVVPLVLELCTDELSGLAPIRFDYLLHNLGAADKDTLRKREELYKQLIELIQTYDTDETNTEFFKYAKRVCALCEFFDYVVDNNWFKALEILKSSDIVPNQTDTNIIDQWKKCYEGSYQDPVPKYIQAIYPSVLRAVALTYRNRYDELKETTNNINIGNLQALRQRMRNLCSGHTKLMRDHISPEVFSDIGEIEASFE